MLRTIGGVLAGFVVLGASVAGLQWVGMTLYPPPPDVAIDRYVDVLPAPAWLAVALSEVVGALLGGLTAAWIARERARAVAAVVVGLGLVGSVINWISFPHPLWFMALQLVGYPAALFLVWRVAASGGPPQAEAGTA